jgi:hypothetical protein
MLDEAKQAFAFKPGGDMAPAVFARAPDDVAHKRTCAEINRRLDENFKGTVHNCGDVWSDDTSLYFNLKYSLEYGKRLYVDAWKVRLDRVTGRLEVNSYVHNNENNKNMAWGKADWALVCKKVDKLVDAK